MGSSFNCQVFKGELTPADLHRKFSAHCDEQEYEYGHSPYNGTLSTTSGLKVEDRLFPNRREAEDYVSRNTEKWGRSLAVRYRRTKKVTLKEPTFRGEKRNSHEFEKCLELFYDEDGTKVVPADQLSDKDKKRVVEAYNLMKETSKLQKSLEDELRRLCRVLSNTDEDFTEEDFKSLKKTRRELKKAKATATTANKKFHSLDEMLGKRILVTETQEDGTRWLVGGWVSE